MQLLMSFYYIIAYILPLLLAVWTFLASENERVKAGLVALILSIYVGPFFLPLSGWFWYFGRIILGIGCFLYLRWHGVRVK